MNLKSISKSIVSDFSRNIKCNWRDWQNLRISIREGTYISRYWDKFYKKRYNIYSKLDLKLQYEIKQYPNLQFY